MKAISFINRRFNSARYMPRSVRIMRAVAGVGVAVAVIALVLAQSIGSGFERVYRKSLLDFNAHVIVMGAGEIEDAEGAIEALGRLGSAGAESDAIASRWGWLAQAASAIEGAWIWLADLHATISYRFEHDSAISRAWGAIDPERLEYLVPDWISDPLARLVESIERSIESESIFLYREALIIGSGGIKGVVIKGMDPKDEQSVGGMKIEYFETDTDLAGAFELERSKRPMALMGKALAGSMGMGGRSGKVRMLIPREEGGTESERFKEVEVVGTFESGMHDYDMQFMLMDIDVVRRLFGAGEGTVTGIEVRLTDPRRAEWVAAAAERVLGPRYRAITWKELNADLIAAVKLEKLVTSLIMTIMLIVAALNIIAALVLTTMHRLREISVLKSLGLSDRRIERLFIRGGLKVGMRGVVVGLVLGLGAAIIIKKFKVIPLEAEIYLVDALPIDISWLICGIITFFCAVAIYITSRIAASRLAKVPPAEGLAQAR